MVKKKQNTRQSQQTTPVKPKKIAKKTKAKAITVSIDVQMARKPRQKNNSTELKKLSSDTGFSTQQLAVRWDLITKLPQKDKTLIESIAKVL